LDGSSYGYAGEWTDSSGLQYLRARYYSPTQGRFTSKDPFPGLLTQPASLTPYVYALNSPALLTDPSGLTPDWFEYVAGAAYQFLDDYSLGAFSDLIADYDYNPNSHFQTGRCMGRNISIAAAYYEGAVGAALIAAAFTLLPPTTGGMLVFALPSGGVTILLGGTAIVGELVVAGAGGMAALHAGWMFRQIKANPVSGGNNTPQFHKLSDGEIKMLQDAGYDIHDLKGGRSASKYDLFKDADGNIYQKPKNGTGPGEDLGINLNDLQGE